MNKDEVTPMPQVDLIEDIAPEVARPPTQDELPCDDGVPLETQRHRQQMELLIRSLRPWLEHHPDGGYVGGNMFVYFSQELASRKDAKAQRKNLYFLSSLAPWRLCARTIKIPKLEMNFQRCTRPDSPGSHIQGCVWPAEGAPKFILQVMPAPSNMRESIDLGEGYDIVDVEGLSGEAAVAIQQPNPQYGITEGVAIMGIIKGSHIITLSPVLLDIKEGSSEFIRLKELADKAAQRL